MLYAIKVGSSDGAAQQIVEAETAGAALRWLEQYWEENRISAHTFGTVVVSPASALNFGTGVDYETLSPERKLEVLKEMGFVAFWEQHQPDCPNQWDSGLRCNCIPPGTSWRAPSDVKEHMHETTAELKEKSSGRNQQ